MIDKFFMIVTANYRNPCREEKLMVARRMTKEELTETLWREIEHSPRASSFTLGIGRERP